MTDHEKDIMKLSFILCTAGVIVMSCGGRYDVTALRPDPARPCDQLEESSCHQDDRCLATYEISEACAANRCSQILSYNACISRPSTQPTCDAVSCQLHCAFGYATDTKGCPLCACLPPMIPCEEMNETQCDAAQNCRGLYRSLGPSSDEAPCPPNDPNCGRLAPPRQTEFVSCHPIEDRNCRSNADCPGGYCEISTNRRFGPYDAPENEPPQTSKQCLYPECNDGSILRCRVAQPWCEQGFIATIRDGCWACVNKSSCRGESCDEPLNVNRTYISRDPEECRQVMSFVCPSDEEEFRDDCGCGCQTRTQIRCPPASQDLIYVARDPLLCARISYHCTEGFSAFSSDCGCGCARPTANPPPVPPPSRVYDCGEGTEVLCKSLPPTCSSRTILTVRNQCWACIPVEQCG